MLKAKTYNGKFDNDFKVAAELGNIILPVLNTYFKNGGEVIHTEHLNESIAQLLDRYSGVDAIYKNGYDISGVALRVQQHSDTNWKTYTIRYSRHNGSETEFNKRLRQIYSSNNHIIYPHFTCQAYMDKDNKLLGGGFCLTKELFDVARKYGPPFKKKGESDVYLQVNKSDKNQFVVVPFKLLTRILLFPIDNEKPIDNEEVIIDAKPELSIQLEITF